MAETIVPQLGMSAPKCRCTTYCEKGVDPMSTCICKMPGEVITAYCDQCDPSHQRFTWHADGSCLNCANRVREERKKQMAERHARIMASPANPVEITDGAIEEADYRPAEPAPAQKLWSPPESAAPAASAIVLRMNGVDIVLTTDGAKIAKTLQDLIR